MEDKLLQMLEDVGYKGPMLDSNKLSEALKLGAKSPDFTSLVSWFSEQLATFVDTDETVHATASADDASSFLLELSFFLKEIGCMNSKLMTGHMNERLANESERSILIEFLAAELMACKLLEAKCPKEEKQMEVTINESDTARHLKNMLVTLKFQKPPDNISPELLFSRLETKLSEVLKTVPSYHLDKPLINVELSAKQWEQLGKLQEEMHKEYTIRREMLLKRLDVTIQSFLWSDRVKSQETEINTRYNERRKTLKNEPNVALADLLAARDDLAVIEKTSNASVRKNTRSKINSVIIGAVPDRGGRPYEQEPPPPEMPPWQKDRVQGPPSFQGGRGGGGGGGRGGGGRGGGGGDRGVPHVPRDMHMAEAISDESEQRKIGRMNSTILDNFTKLKDGNDSVRLNAGVTLLNYLRQHNADQDDKELNYALARLVRTLGSSMTDTRRGVYSTLTVFLMMHPDTPVEKLLSIMNTQLQPASSNAKGENADIYMGRILLCGALIRSKLLVRNSVEMQQQITEILLNSGKQRSYLSFISVTFLSEFVVQLDIESMKNVWPIIEKEIGKPWSEQTLDTFYVLLIIRDKHPSLVNHKFLKEHLGVKEIITKESMEDIVKVLTALPRIISYQHPVFKLFCEKLVATEFVADFWKGIDQKFVKPSWTDEYVAVEILRLILLNVTDKTVIPSLLSPNLLQHMLKRFSNCKRNNNDAILVAFRKVLHLMVSATNDEDIKMKTQLSILKKLILHPGDLMIEKKTGVKVIQIITGNLKIDGIKKLCQLYRDIIENKMTKEKEGIKVESWTNAERSYTAQLLTKLMGRQDTLLDQDWRLEQLMFLFNYGLCEVSNVGIELAQQFKDSFYRALDYKLPKLDNARNLLSALVHNLDSKLQSDTIQLRSPLNNTASDAWKKVIALIENLEKNTKNLEALPIFHTMNLHMGLQLFSDPETAIMSINELQCCYERLSKKSKGQKKLNVVTEEEPEWVEVVVDLLLSLLSKNDHLFRSLVACVFPHICPYLTPSAVHQILAVLDIKNTRKTLMTKRNDDEDSSGIESESDNGEDEEDESTSNNEVLSNSESESDESKDEDENEDEDETETDKLRMALHQVLGNAAMQTDDEDIDVDEIGEEEGKRLDESLAAAFKLFRENRQAHSKKQGKTSQALMHFRARVIDLLHIYLDICPSMAVTLDMIVPLFALLEFCIKDPHQEPLAHRIRTCLKKLSTVKKFKDTTDVDDTLLTTVLKALIEKGERSASICQELNDKLAECCTFLVRCAQQANLSTKSIVEIYGENLTAFFKKRDCVLSSMLFKGVLQLCWEDNWQLALLLVDFAFDSSIRYFRRNQALELLLIFYNNNRLLNMNTKYVDVRMKLETTLCKNVIDTLEEICDLNNDNVSVQKKVRQRFIGHLLTLLRIIHARHLPQAWDWQAVKTVLTKYRSRSALFGDAKIAYNKLATEIGVPLNVSSMKNTTLNSSGNPVSQSNGKQSNVGSQNGKASNSEEEEKEGEATHDDQERKKRRKNKSKQRDKRLLKKEARELRAKVMSQDMELFKFSSVSLAENEDATEVIQNGKSHDKSTNSSQKRNQTTEDGREPKRRKSTSRT